MKRQKTHKHGWVLGFIGLLFFLCVWLTNCGGGLHSRIQWIRAGLDPVLIQPSSASQNLRTLLDVSSEIEDHPYFSSSFQKKVDEQTGSQLFAGNQLELLPNKKSFEVKIDLIKKAKTSIYISTLQLMCDKSGNIFIDELIAAKQRGVDVRLIIDGGFWGIMFEGSCFSKMQKAGIVVLRSHPYVLTTYWTYNIHEKLQIVDDEFAILGGQNIGSWWADSNGLDNNFRDTDVLVKGPVVNAIVNHYLNIFHTIRPNDFFVDLHRKKIAKTQTEVEKKGLAGQSQYALWLQPHHRKGLCRFVAQNPRQKKFDVFEAYKLFAQFAQHRVIFHVPSLNALGSPQQESLRQALIDLANRGGQIDVITNGPGLIRSRIIAPSLGRLYGYLTLNTLYNSILDTPFNVFTYHSWLHSKVYFFDGIATAIGSFNFDETGVNWAEDTLICIDPHLSAQTAIAFASDLANSQALTTPKTMLLP